MRLWRSKGKKTPSSPQSDNGNNGNDNNKDNDGNANGNNANDGNGNGNRRRRNPGAVGTTVFRVRVPQNVQPGEEFQVYAGNQIVRVRCPMASRPGQSLQITVPSQNNNNNSNSNRTEARMSLFNRNDSNSNSNSNNDSSQGNGNSNSNSNINGGNATDNSYPSRRDNYDNNYGRDHMNSNGSGNSSSHPSNPQSPSWSSEFTNNNNNNNNNYHQPLNDAGNGVRRTNHTSVRRIAGSDPPAYMVAVPPNVSPGQKFQVDIRGQQLLVTCPENASPGVSVRIVPPPLLGERPTPSPQGEPRSYQRSQSDGYGHPTMADLGDGNGDWEQQQLQPQQQQQNRHQQNERQQGLPEREKTQLFEVEVPQGVQPGAPFALLAGGVRVLVTCPINAGPGLRIRFKLPLSLTQQQADNASSRRAPNEMHQIKLAYDKDGWTRTVRANEVTNDFKFQWIRLDANGNIDNDVMSGMSSGRRRFNMDKSAYVRRLEFKLGEDPRIRTGLLSLVPATESVVDTKIKSADGRDLVTYGDLAQAQMKSFDEKTAWFQDTCQQLEVEWDEGHMRMNIRRQYLLGDSVDAVMSLSRKDLRKTWRFEFIGEQGIDAGGLIREWFELVCREIFDPDTGLWMSSATNQMSMTINPASEYCCDDHLVFFRFLGRCMGKALFHRQLIMGHMVKHLYKHILGWPISFKDLEAIDEQYYNNLKELRSMHENGDDISMLCLDFTMTFEMMGIKKTVDLVPGGADIDVTNDNFPEYVEACLKYKLMGCIKPQLNELLLGFFDVIPEPLLTIFDYQELELIMCGLPHIDLDDWKRHTAYSGEYEELCIHHPTVEWFWETLEEFNDEMRARLLLFVTGTSGVPSRGFGVLQSNDGNIRNFTIHGVSAKICYYPRAHTCFNRIDLPLYDSKRLLQERLKLAVTMSATGFDIE